jgi:hypothetical protein
MTVQSNGNEARRTSNRRTNLRHLDPHEWFKPSKEYHKKKNWFPNQCFTSTDRKEVIIQCKRSDWDKDWSVSARAAYDMEAAEHEGKIEQAYVRFVNPDNSYVNSDTLGNVLRKIGKIEPMQGDYGDYWWLNANFEPAESGNPLDKSFPV